MRFEESKLLSLCKDVLTTAIVLVLFSFGAISASAQNSRRAQSFSSETDWLRSPAISPDGRKIAFSVRGRLWVVSTQGGRATRLTNAQRYETSPIWSPDGTSIAYAAENGGGLDVYMYSLSQGVETQLTTHSADESPTSFTPDGREVLFVAHRMDDAASSGYPNGSVSPELYSVSIRPGSEPRQLLTTPALNASFDTSGRWMLYEDVKGYESPWRKHNRLSAAHDIWLFDSNTKQHRKLTSSTAEDRNPVFSPRGSILYLSEENGSSNVVMLPLSETNTARIGPSQQTRFTTFPVRSLSISRTELMAYSVNGQIYTQDVGKPPKVLNIRLPRLEDEPQVLINEARNIVTSAALSNDGEKVAFVVRGRLLIDTGHSGGATIVESKPGVSDPTFSPDGEKVSFVRQAGAIFQLMQRSVGGSSSPAKILLRSNTSIVMPRWSPDGSRIAYLSGRGDVRVLDTKTGEDALILTDDRQLMSIDDDRWLAWSPDSKQLLVQRTGAFIWAQDIWVLDVDRRRTAVVVTNGRRNLHPRWALKGAAIVWNTDLEGMRTEQVDGGADTRDVMALFASPVAASAFQKAPASYAVYTDPTLWDGFSTARAYETAQLRVRITEESSDLADAVLLDDGRTLILRRGDAGTALHIRSSDGQSSTKVFTAERSSLGPSDIMLSKDQRSALVLSGGDLYRINIVNASSERIVLPATPVSRSEERIWEFARIRQQIAERFHDEKLKGLDWEGIGDAHSRFVPGIRNDRDFAELASELLGELDSSHTGAFFRPMKLPALATAALGMFSTATEKGARIDEVLTGGPLDQDQGILQGDVITSINGTSIADYRDMSIPLQGVAGMTVRLEIERAGISKQIAVSAISMATQERLLYLRWVAQRRDEVRRLSNGTLAYVHMAQMSQSYLSDAFTRLFGEDRDKAGVIVDTRGNGGGSVHDQLLVMLSGRNYMDFSVRGVLMNREPQMRWAKPSAVIVNEANYSDGFLFPYAYQKLGLGSTIGAPIPGSGAFIGDWEGLLEPRLNFGINKGAFLDERMQVLDNQELKPDLEIYNDPASVASGLDRQLAEAVRVMADR